MVDETYESWQGTLHVWESTDAYDLDNYETSERYTEEVTFHIYGNDGYSQEFALNAEDAIALGEKLTKLKRFQAEKYVEPIDDD